jgi:uncharacterized damage-inducible protein DinB
VPSDSEIGFPEGNPDEREMLLSWLDYLRGAVLRDIDGVSDHGARWTPEGRLISLLGIVNHLTHVEWRWIEGSMLGQPVTRNEGEFAPADYLDVARAVAACRERGERTDAVIRGLASLDQPSRADGTRNARWVVLHLINETARHAGHADATRELLDGWTGE